MKISNRFTIAVHMLAMMEIARDIPLTSEMMAGSVNTHPVVIRRISGMLKKAGMIEVRAGTGGAFLKRDLKEITLREVYSATGVVADLMLFNVHASPNPRCPVGANIQKALNGTLEKAQAAMEETLDKVTVADIVFKLVQSIKGSS